MLQVELTESAVFEHREARTGESSEDAISQLRELGVRIAIDDFGTGYSSLSYLKRWRVDYVKIDRSFVRDLVTDMSDLAIVGAIIAMARHLNIQVVAEGIEGWQQLEKLRQLHCNLAQGYPVRQADAGRAVPPLPHRRSRSISRTTSCYSRSTRPAATGASGALRTQADCLPVAPGQSGYSQNTRPPSRSGSGSAWLSSTACRFPSVSASRGRLVRRASAGCAGSAERCPTCAASRPRCPRTPARTPASAPPRAPARTSPRVCARIHLSSSAISLLLRPEYALATGTSSLVPPHAERVVRVEIRAPPVAGLRVDHHRIERIRLDLPLPPRAALPPRAVRRIARLQHQPFDAARAGFCAQRGQLLPASHAVTTGESDSTSGAPASSASSRARRSLQRQLANVHVILLEQVVREEAHRHALENRRRELLAADALLQLRERPHGAVAPRHQLAIEHDAVGQATPPPRRSPESAP